MLSKTVSMKLLCEQSNDTKTHGLISSKMIQIITKSCIVLCLIWGMHIWGKCECLNLQSHALHTQMKCILGLWQQIISHKYESNWICIGIFRNLLRELNVIMTVGERLDRLTNKTKNDSICAKKINTQVVTNVMRFAWMKPEKRCQHVAMNGKQMV